MTSLATTEAAVLSTRAAICVAQFAKAPEVSGEAQGIEGDQFVGKELP
jgi:hypothetical protein